MPKKYCRRLMLAIETDATRYHGDSATRPRLLNTNDAEQLLAHISADLTALLAKASECRLITVGALFDQTQVLRPNYPVFSALEKLITENHGSSFPGSVAIGAENERVPYSGLQPESDIPLGLLQILPVVISGPSDVIDELGEAMEHRFLEEGQLSPHTARWLESAFAIKINHVRFMTLMDLNAMFRLQMEHFGFLPLWKMLDAALNNLPEPVEVSLENDQTYQWIDGVVRATFQSFDYWSNQGGGKNVASDRGTLSESYAHWTRKNRQLITVLNAHQVPLEFQSSEQLDETFNGSFLVEKSKLQAHSDSAVITEHSFAELGVICVTVTNEGHQKNYYPLTSEGLNDIHKAIRSSGPSGRTVAFPGSILFDQPTRLLKGESLSD
jgi:hypothetical protein